jgi:hypothetical protein
LRRAWNPAVEIFLWSRGAIWAAAVFALLVFEPNRSPLADRFDRLPYHDLGYLTDVWARWDSGWYISIAQDGYTSLTTAPAFFPLYPGLVGIIGRVLFGHYLLAGILVSLASALSAFVLLYRLAEARLGAEGGRRAVLYLAVFPTALFLQAVYSESLYLALALAAFWLAERNRFFEGGMVAGLALLTRPVGVAVVAGIAILAWQARERVRALAGVCLAPLMFLAYPLLLWQQVDDAWAFVHAQGLWDRHFSWAGPFGGLWDGVQAGWRGAEQLATESPAISERAGLRFSDTHTAILNVEGLLFLALFLVLSMIVWRRFGTAYGVFCAASLAVPLSFPTERWPLLSLPRFGLVVFPFFLALAALGRNPRVNTAVITVSSLFLGVFIVQWALWQFVA